MGALQVVMVVAFIIASLGWVVGVWSEFLKSRKKSRYYDPHEDI